ncbi:hypothetical protein THAOC_26724, partial [Thalassiosira oceanica]
MSSDTTTSDVAQGRWD